MPTGTGRLGHTLLAYRLSDHGRVIFAGDRFCPPLSVSIDSDACVVALLPWFTLRPGDTDAEFFYDYTEVQWAWVEEGRADELAVIVGELQR